jgi:hypothetical protein
LFPFQQIDLHGGLKYLGFFIKPNDYSKKDWDWLIAKIEKRLSVWCNQWLSRGGRLILLKSVVEAIPIYWMTLAYIPRGVLGKLRRIGFRFIWLGRMDIKGIPSVK